MAFHKWNLQKCDPALVKILAEECGISMLAASVLVARGHSSYEDAMDFLTPEEELLSPFALAGMEIAVERLRAAIDNFERITIYGDYDCDGVTSTAMLYTYLSSVGGDVGWYIPERDGEGYGLNRQAVKALADNGTRLLVTVDNGISAIDEVAYAKELGMDVIVTDHHQPGDILPDALAVVDPHRVDCESGYKDLAGVGVTFKLIAALEDGDYETALDYFADIVAVGTVGDLVPLTGENRILVRRGLRALSMSDNIGLLALMKICGVDPQTVSGQSISFGLAPRINAAGRMGSARLAMRLLLSEDEDEAASLATELDLLNKKRQEEEAFILKDIEGMIAADRTLLDGRLLILKGAGWNHGIIGIICSRLVERYGKPTLLLAADEDGTLRGSGRSIGEFHLFKALSANAEWLTQYGGHKMAAGFSLEAERFADFCKGMEQYAGEKFDLMPQLTYAADKCLESADISVEAVESLAVLEPFGTRNEAPLFLLKNARLEAITPMSDDKHQRLSLTANGQKMTALWFGMPSKQFSYQKGQMVDLLVGMSLNTYNGAVSVSLKVKDMRMAGFVEGKFFAAKGYYEKLRRKEPVSSAIAARGMPDRNEIAGVYRYLRQNGGFAGDIDNLFLQLSAMDINYCRLRVVLDILEEAQLLTISPALDNITLNPAEGKADLSSTPTMRRLLALQKK